MTKPRAVIFDRDGVLTYFDVEGAQAFFQPLLPFSIFELAKRWQQWGAQVGFPTTDAEEEQFFAGFWQTLRDENKLDDEQYHTLVGCRYTDFMRSYADAREVLLQLRRAGVRIGVLSNFSLASLEASLEAVGLADCVDVACAATVIGYAKPEPQAYRHVAHLLDVVPEACLFFDDEAPCVEGAREVGMKAYVVDRTRRQDDRANGIIHNLYAALELYS
jgi:putative hydrolase of the HAD superfamily